MKSFILFFLTSSLLFSVNLVPLYQTVDSKESSRMVYTLYNSTKEPVAVVFSCLRVLSTHKEKEERVKTDKLSAYPTQMVIKAGASKKVRVRYLGSSLPKEEEVYRVIAKELDINVNDEIVKDTNGKVETSLKVSYTYEGLLFVNEKGLKADLKIDTFSKTLDKNNNMTLNLLIKNEGSASVVPNIKRYKYVVTTANKDYILEPKDMTNTNIRRVLAKSELMVTIKNIKSLPSANITAVRLEKR